MRKYKFILTFTLLFLTVEISQAQQGRVIRPRPQEALETRTRINAPRKTSRVPQRPTDIQRSEIDSLDSNNLPDLFQPNRSSKASHISENLRRLGLQESYSRIEPSLNHTQRGRLERSISLLAEYSQNTRPSNKQAELVEKLGQAVLLSPTHSFIGHVIRTLTAGQITSPNKISGIITVLNEARSFTTRTTPHKDAIDRALFRNGYSKDKNGAWCI